MISSPLPSWSRGDADPTKRRQGLAKAALTGGENAAFAAGANAMFLEVAEDNTAAKALYAACGYAQVGRRPGYYLPKNAAPVAALVMRKELKVVGPQVMQAVTRV